MQISTWLVQAKKKLRTAKVTSYNLDSLILLEYVTNHNKAHILANTDKELTNHQLSKLNELLNRRISREPLAYILGYKDFYGRQYIVSPDVLIPRPESESFINLIVKHKINNQTIVDVGCGSGILGITIKLELPTNTIILSDNNKKALKVAKLNIAKHKINCKVICADLVPSGVKPDIIICNLPYVPTNFIVQPELQFEPRSALFAEKNGMQLYNKLWEIVVKKSSTKFVLTESLQFQHKKMLNLATKAGFSLLETDGLVQLFVTTS